MSISQRFKTLLFNLNLSAKELAIELNVAPSTVSKSVNGGTLPSSKMLVPLGEKLNVNINWLLFGHGEIFLSKSNGNNRIQKIETNQGIISQVDGNSNINYGTNNKGEEASKKDCSKLEIENDRLKLENKFLKKSLTDKERLINLLEKNQK